MDDETILGLRVFGIIFIFISVVSFIPFEILEKIFEMYLKHILFMIGIILLIISSFSSEDSKYGYTNRVLEANKFNK